MDEINERDIQTSAFEAFDRFCEWRKHNQRNFRPTAKQKEHKNWLVLGEASVRAGVSPSDIVDWIVKHSPKGFPPLAYFKSPKRIKMAITGLRNSAQQLAEKPEDCEYIEATVKNNFTLVKTIRSRYNTSYENILMDQTIPISALGRYILAHVYCNHITEKLLPILREELAGSIELKRQFSNYNKKYNLGIDVDE